MSAQVLLAYVVAVSIIVAVPGPNIVLIMSDSVRFGFNKSLLTILGVQAGTSFLICLSLIGLTALLTLFSCIFTIIKWLGVFYLLYIGMSQIISSFKRKSSADVINTENSNLFLKGFFVSATNPKGLLFAAAFFPQFINEQLSIATQVTVLFIGFFLVSFFIEIIYAYGAHTGGRLFKTQRFKRITERVSGAFLIMFGLGLSFVEQD